MKGISSIFLFAGILLSTNIFAQHLIQEKQFEVNDPHKRIHELLTRPNRTVSEKASNFKGNTLYETSSFSPDTSWSFDEFRESPQEAYQPGNHSLDYDIGSASYFTRIHENRIKIPDSTAWRTISESRKHYFNQFLDSTLTINYSEKGTRNFARRTRYVREPRTGASSEYYVDHYIPSGWKKYQYVSTFYNTDSTDYWYRNSLYDENLGRYYLFELVHSVENDSSSQLDTKRYDPNGITYWFNRSKKYDEQHRLISETESQMNATKDGVIPTDSVHFNYLENYTSAEEFTYSEEFGWEPLSYSRTFTSPFSMRDGIRKDSVVSYYLVKSDGEYIPGEVLAKTIYLYDGNENLIEQAYYNYRTHPDHPFVDKLVYSYELIVGEYLQTEERYLKWDSSINSFYTVWIQTWEFSETGFLFDQSALQFSLYGDTTSFTKTQHVQSGDMLYSVLYDWDSQLKKLIRKETGSFRASAPVIQIASNKSDFNYRFIEVSDGYPAVFNNGPIQIALGDTLNFTIKAFNPDLSVPSLVIENMPASATLNEENNQFFWIVDDLNPDPMIYTVTDHGLSYSTTISFISGELAVQNETNQEVPDQIQLHQNYPNPFNPNTTISYELPENSEVRVQIFDMLGRQVAELVHQTLAAGSYSVSFDAQELSSGVYFYRLSTPQYSVTKRMLLLK